MSDDRPGDSPLAYRQWDDNPTWCLDRGRDDRHMDPPDVPVGAEPAYSNFHAAIVSQKEKHAQATDAAIAFLSFKKQAGILSTMGEMALKHPHMTGAAVGAGVGAIAGGPNHRLGGALVGGGLGAAAGGMGAKSLHGMQDARTAGEIRQMGQGMLHPAPAATAAKEMSGAEQIKQLHQPPPPQMYGAPNHAQEVGVIRRPVATPQGTPAGQVPARANPGATANTELASPPTNPGLANQSPAAVDAARRELAANGGKPMMGIGQAPATGPATGYVKQPMAQTVKMDKFVPQFSKMAVGPAPGQANKRLTVVSGPLTGISKEAGADAVLDKIVNPTTMGAIGGGTLGSMYANKDHPFRSTLTGAAMGASLGGLHGQVAKIARELTPTRRADLPKKDFAMPHRTDDATGQKGGYPIPDRHHAAIALGFAKMHHDPAAEAAVKHKVEQKYPDMVKQAFMGIFPFSLADDSLNAAVSGGSSAKTASALGEAAVEAINSSHPATKVLPAGAMAGMLDDAGTLARKRLVDSMHRQNKGQQDQHPAEPQVKVADGLITPLRILGETALDVADVIARKKLTSATGIHTNHREKRASPFDSTTLFDAKQRAAERFPEKVTPIEAIRTDVKSNLQLLHDKVQEIGQAKHNLANPVEKTAAVPTAGITSGRAILERLLPRQVLTPEGLGVALGGGLLGAGMGYMGSRGKKEHGGRSDAEVATDKWKNRQAEKPEGILPTIGKHVADLHADVAEQMRKHPVASTALGGLSGATIALRLAALAGLGSHLK